MGQPHLSVREGPVASRQPRLPPAARSRGAVADPHRPNASRLCDAARPRPVRQPHHLLHRRLGAARDDGHIGGAETRRQLRRCRREYRLFLSLLAHRLVGPEGRIHAIEATPSTADLLDDNIARNDAGAIRVHRCAASDREGMANMVVHDAGNIGSNHLSFDREGAGAGIPLRRLDSLLAGEAIRLIKLDIEGAEAMALRGAGALLDGDTTPALLFEFSPNMLRGMGDDPAALLAHLEGKGYTIYEIHPNRLTPRDDSILARTQTYLLALKPGDPLHAALGG
ncbi:FkbM family methyltransferase [Sphingopyxis sp.]|uniref:FkbM family methyltransferase n=1 Tax=Sphingopyxis sp. TaxID=1908224 RepID=UPI002FCBB074